MPILFQGQAGRVIRLDDPAVQGQAQLVSLSSGDEISFEGQRSIITRMTMSHQANVQFLHTLGAAIYIYVFGDRMGQVMLSGLSFTGACEGEDDGEPGAEKMLTWYKDHRVAAQESPIRVMIGNTPIEGFTVGFTEDVVDPALMLVQWGVTMMTLPTED